VQGKAESCLRMSVTFMDGFVDGEIVAGEFFKIEGDGFDEFMAASSSKHDLFESSIGEASLLESHKTVQFLFKSVLTFKF
jgi:hypothetical protein